VVTVENLWGIKKMTIRGIIETTLAIIILVPLVTLTIAVGCLLVAVFLLLVGLASPIIALWIVIVMAIEIHEGENPREQVKELINRW